MANHKLARKLYDAVKKKDIKAVQKYLDLGADPNLPVGKDGRTAMMRAKEKKLTEIESLLFEYGGKGEQQSEPAQQETASAEQETSNEYDDVDTHPNAEYEPEDEDTEVSMKSIPVPEDRVQPEFSRFSSLADGVRASVKRKPKTISTDLYDAATLEGSSTDGDANAWGSSLQKDDADGSDLQNDPLKFNRSKVKQIKKLGEGHFGIVFEGEAEGLVEGEDTTRVAVKMLTETTTEAILDFNKEVQIMKSIAGSDHIVQLLGICVEEQPYLMLMELMGRGDLKTLLRSSRPKLSKDSPLSLRKMLTMGADVADGMAFLQRRKIVHRDLAARNCLVNEDWRVKIGDFGLTRDVYAGEYYRMTGSSPLPVRWMAPEAIEDGMYTSQSDIWAYGIVLWELSTFAKMPYPGLSNMEVVDRVAEEGYRMPEPKECPDGLYAIMLQCWDEIPTSRPDFLTLKSSVLDLASKASDDFITKKRTRQVEEQAEEPSTKEIQPNDDGEVVIDGVVYVRNDNLDDSGALYSQDAAQKYPQLSSFELAVQVAKDQKAIQKVERDDTAHDVVFSNKKSEENEIDDDSAPTMSVKDRMATLNKNSTSSTPSSPINVTLKKVNKGEDTIKHQPDSELPPAKERGMSVSAMKDVWLQHGEQAKRDAEKTNFEKYRTRGSMSLASGDTLTKKEAKQLIKEEKKLEKLKKEQEKKELKEQKKREKEEKKAAKEEKKATKRKKPVYGGAKSWVTSGVATESHVIGLSDESKRRASESQAKSATLRTKPTPSPQVTNAVETPSPLKPSEIKKQQQKSSTIVTKPHTFVPQKEEKEKQQLRGERVNTISMPKKGVEANDAITASAHLSMDKSIHTAAEKIEEWIEAAIGDYVSGDSLFEILQSGEILCQVMNKISPGCIPKYHKASKLAFRKMENIGYFLEAAKAYGLPSTDLFITVDLFEGQNMKQVVICLAALKKLAEMKGVRF